MPPYPLTIFEIQRYYQNKTQFNGVYSKNCLHHSKNGAYVINLDEYKLIGTHCIALFVNADNITYCDGFRNEHIPKEIKNFIGNKNITTNIYGIQAYDSIICGYFCVGFNDFVFKGKSLTNCTNLFLPNNFKNNEKVISRGFLIETNKRMADTPTNENKYMYLELDNGMQSRLN